MTRPGPHPIEQESYRILRARYDFSALPPLSRAVAERICHACADVSLAPTLALDEQALEQGRHALRAGAEIVCDARMVAAGITSRPARVALDDARVRDRAAAEGITRSAAAMRLAAAEATAGAVWVVGNAPTALRELVERPPRDPALVIGLPVGFVGADEAKAALIESGIPCLANRGERGGSALAVAAVNALLYVP